jgi:hypothetical protein
MGRLMGWHRGRHGRRLVAALAGTMLGLLCAVTSARAETLPVTCANLQSTVTTVGSAPGHGEGDAIVLNGLCNGASLGSTSGITLPEGSAFTLEGAAGTTSGIDGAGITGPLLAGEKLGAITIAGLTFQHAVTSGFGASAVNLRAARVTLSGDSFLNDNHEGVFGGALFASAGSPCPAPGGPPLLTLTGSTFRENTNTIVSNSGVGGAAFLTDNCAGGSNVVTANVFEGNSLRANGSSKQAEGGGLALFSESKPGAEALTQEGNVFANNSVIEASGPPGQYGGGGEWVAGFAVTSRGDRFSGNTLPGTSGSMNWSWGAGLGVLACSNTEPSVSTVENAVIEGNVIGAGEAAELGGAGLYVGCTSKETPNHMSLLDSTVTGNAVGAGGVAGIDGGAHDQLQIANSIVAGDTGGSETGGFAGEGGILSAAFSDVCASGSSAPLAGEGNICAAPALADEGNPGSFDVHESASSPTIDAGRNTLVPAGLATDYFGGPRIVAGSVITACGAALFGPAIVDMGASEAPAGTRVRALSGGCFPHLPARAPATSSFVFPAVAVGVNGVLTLTFPGPLEAGNLALKATFKRTRIAFKRVNGRRRRIRRMETLTFGNASYSVAPPLGSAGVTNLRVKLKPTAQTLKLLARAKRLKVLLSVTYTQQGLLPGVQSHTLTVRYKAPPRRHRHR